jgi:antitoxin VapB
VPRKYRATLFTNGGSQAVRLPRECRLEGKVVEIWRDGSRLIVEPIEKPGWPAGFWKALERNPLPADFDIGEELPDQPERAADWLDRPLDE